MIHDPSLPLLTDLVDEMSAAELLTTVLDGTARVGRLRITHVSHRPGRRATIRYATSLDHEDGTTEDAAFTVWTGDRIPEGGVRVRAGSDEAAIWRFPDDPRLPGLTVAMTPELLSGVLSEIGLESDPIVTLRAYRPGRRAVVEAVSGHHKVFVKLVRPDRVSHLQGLHASLAPEVPVPRSHGWSPDLGLVVLEPLPGETLSSLLRSTRAESIPSPTDLTDLLDTIARVGIAGPGRSPSIARIEDHASSLAVILPDAASKLDAIVAAASNAPTPDPVSSHRDFHAGQLVISGDSMGLVDIDTVGSGSRADDYAMFLAHLVALARPGAAGAAVIDEYVRVLAETWGDEVGSQVLAPRVSASLLGFASGPFRVQEAGWEVETQRRVDAAEGWSRGVLTTSP